MRENKYRVWDKEQGKFFEPTYRAYDGELSYLMLSMGGRLHLVTIGRITDESVFPDRFVLQWFIGRKDKTGREIYEGDRVKAESLERGQGCIEWDGHGFWIIEPSGTRTMPFDDKMEIIGNIYENPEILNGG